MAFLNRILLKAVDTLASFFLAAIVVLVFLAALSRWFNYPLIWSVDTAQLLFGWLCFFGADAAMRHNSHIGMDILVRLLPQGAQRGIRMLLMLCTMTFLGIIAVYGFILCYHNYERLFNTIQISYSWATLSVPVGCLLMLRTTVEQLLRERANEAGSEGGTNPCC